MIGIPHYQTSKLIHVSQALEYFRKTEVRVILNSRKHIQHSVSLHDHVADFHKIEAITGASLVISLDASLRRDANIPFGFRRKQKTKWNSLHLMQRHEVVHGKLNKIV